MAATLDVTECERVSLRRARWTREPCAKVLQFEGGEAVPNRARLWPDRPASPEVDALHDVSAPPALTADVFTHFVRDVTVGGAGGMLRRDDRFIVNRDCYPNYVGAFIEREISRPYWEIEPRRRTLSLDRAFVITHFNSMYGHWLLEIFPKLFAIKALMRQGLKAPILVPSHLFGFVKATLADVVPECKVIEYDRLVNTVRVKRAILPGMMQRDYVFNVAFHRALADFLAPIRAKPGPQAIFVSRAGWRGAFRRLENVEALDAAAADLGLTVIRPETLPWLEQVRLFTSARLVVGEFGSGMHNALFSPPGAKVVCLNIVNELQSRIANACGHDVGYLLDPDGAPRKLSLGWETQQGYRIDLDDFSARVGPLVDALGAAGDATH